MAIVAQLSHSLAEHPDAKGVAGFAFLFVVVWWAWFNGAMYHDQHGSAAIVRPKMALTRPDYLVMIRS